ncbi:MAG: di-trans,poly-cis-decaprenylcistransferase [Verrucomicrobia bacterium]|nr:di-trans,poly-cis-decaprenylcistransferase [Verrucomicrobiota bacterium]
MTLSAHSVVTLPAKKIPQHVAIIMDGNRRWAQKRRLPPLFGHMEGVNALYRIVQEAVSLGIEVLTVWGFSTENWRRNKEEVKELLELVGNSAKKFQKPLMEQGVRMHVIGDLCAFPDHVVENLEETCLATHLHSSKGMDLVLALNYGGRDELRRAMVSLAQKVEAGEIAAEAITEEMINGELDTASWRHPDLVIRPGGEKRLSNFMLWQAAYSEIVVQEVLWPDFSAVELHLAIAEYNERERRYGA